MLVESNHTYTMEEYLALERETDARYEFRNGQVFEVSGSTLAHDLILDNMATAMRRESRQIVGRAFSSQMQIKTPGLLPYLYADGSVVCGKIEVERFNGCDLLLNPILIWEVFSKNTEAYDRGDKFTYYKSIPTLKEYLLIAQHRPHVTQYIKQNERIWYRQEFNDKSESIYIPSLEVTLQMNEIYQDVIFPG